MNDDIEANWQSSEPNNANILLDIFFVSVYILAINAVIMLNIYIVIEFIKYLVNVKLN